MVIYYVKEETDRSASFWSVGVAASSASAFDDWRVS